MYQVIELCGFITTGDKYGSAEDYSMVSGVESVTHSCKEHDKSCIFVCASGREAREGSYACDNPSRHAQPLRGDRLDGCRNVSLTLCRGCTGCFRQQPTVG